jgi:hypothetical protein
VAVLGAYVDAQAVMGLQDQAVESPRREEGVEVEADDLLLVRGCEGQGGHRGKVIVGEVGILDIGFRQGQGGGQGENLQGAGGMDGIDIDGEGGADRRGQIGTAGLVGDPSDPGSAIPAQGEDGTEVESLVVVGLAVHVGEEMGRDFRSLGPGDGRASHSEQAGQDGIAR